MRVNRGSGDGSRPSDQGDGAAGMVAPTADQLKPRTDRGNQNDEGIGSSASRGGGGGETNAPEREVPDLDPTPEDPDVTGTTDALGG